MHLLWFGGVTTTSKFHRPAVIFPRQREHSRQDGFHESCCSACLILSSTCLPPTIRLPNGALTWLAGNVDPHHHVAVADLILDPRPFPENLHTKKLLHHCDISSPFVIRKAVNKHAAILLFENAVVK
jgi:hypothetical protein